MAKLPLDPLTEVGHNYQKNFNYHLQAQKVLPLANFEKKGYFFMEFNQADPHAFVEIYFRVY
jgi:hypothetical protein